MHLNIYLMLIFSATVPLRDRAQAGHDVPNHGPGHVPRAPGPRRLRARRGHQHLGHHRQPEQGHHQGDQELPHGGE